MSMIIMFVGIFLAMLLPAMLGTMIADLTWRVAAALAAAVLLIVGYYAAGHSEAFRVLYWKWSLPAPPPAEAAFIAAASQLRESRAAYVAGSAPLAVLHQVEASLCALPAAADGWVGRVAQNYQDSSGQTDTLEIDIWPYLTVRTALFPDATNTLIRSASPAFAQVVGLRQGDVVRFSGRIVGHAGACPGEPPVDRNEKLRDPEFLFSFTRVNKPAE